MNTSKKLLFLSILTYCLLGVQFAFGQNVPSDSLQKAKKIVSDSTKIALKKKTDSLLSIQKYKNSKKYKDSVSCSRSAAINAIKEARKAHFDSLTNERKRIFDSTISVRKANTVLMQTKLKAKSDSLASIRKYRESKRYQDSVLKVKNDKLNAIRLSRTKYFDSLKTIRKKSLDSSINVRKKISDSLKAKIKIKTDSLSKIRKYKESKRYRDSVQITRQSKLDSIRAVRKIYTDNVLTARKKTIDSLSKMRKLKMDSLTKIRKLKSDSLQNARDLRAAEQAKKKEIRDKQLKAEQKRKEDKLKMQFELKMKKKHEAWSNEKMLKKKWTFVRRGFQNMFTRYNYYYNARRKMIEANANMLRRKKDNYEQLIDLFPFDPNKDSTVFSSDMDSIIRKASVGLQIHDPRTKWADDLYLLMGEAYYYKGDYLKADASFRYIIGMNKALKLNKKNKDQQNGQLIKKENSTFKKLIAHQPANNDAVLWLTRLYTDSKKEGEAEAILDLIDVSNNLSSSMKAKLALEKANLLIKQHDYSKAIEQLNYVIKSKSISKNTRQRASFINGQLLFQVGLYDSAAKSFQQNLALHPPIDMDFYAHKYSADAVAQSGADQSKSISSLKKLLKDGKYAPYHEQVYFILGKLSANENKNDEALAFYKKSLEQTKTTPKQKAITFASMGNIQYKMGQYPLAKKSYDSASYFAKNVKDNQELELALRRGRSLDKIEEPYNMLHINDSLLKLSQLSEKEQKAVVKKYLKYLEKQKEDSASNALAIASSGSLGSATTSTSSTSSSWYFGSTVAVQQGYNEFKRKWGNRPLADNWRRASSSSFGSSLNSASNDTSDVELDETNELTEEGLMAAIPKSDAQKSQVRKKIIRSYLNLSTAYVKDLEEFNEGLATLDSLNVHFPNHEYPDEELSILYTAALRQGKLEDAEKLRLDLLTKYPTSTFAKELNNSESTDTTQHLNNTENVANYYETTYQLNNDREYNEVIKRVIIAKRIYGDITYSRKFRILEAQSYAAIGKYKKADTLITEYLKEYPSDSLRPWIDAISKNINDQKIADTIIKDSTNTTNLKSALKTGDTTSLNIKSDTTIQIKNKLEAVYIYNPKEAHYCIFIFGKPDAKTAGFRSGLSDFSTIKFSGITLTTEIEMLNADQTMVLTKSFGTAGQAKIFMNSAKNEKLLFREFEANSFQYLIISEQNFKKLKADKKLEQYLNFYKKNYK